MKWRKPNKLPNLTNHTLDSFISGIDSNPNTNS